MISKLKKQDNLMETIKIEAKLNQKEESETNIQRGLTTFNAHLIFENRYYPKNSKVERRFIESPY